MKDNLGLYAKLHLIMKECSYLQKDKTNQFHKYNYASEKAIKEMLHASLVKNRVLFLPSIVEHSDRGGAGKDGKEFVTAVKVEFKFIDVDTGESETGFFFGTGADGLDKGTYKAVTGALKYILTSWFLIPTGDDPEGEAEKRAERIEKKNKQADAWVEQKRAAEAPAATQPDAPASTKTSKAAGGDWFKTMLDQFGLMKKELGDREYYRILGAFGHEHANTISGRDVAKEIFAEMRSCLNDVRIKKQEAEAMVNA